MTLPDNHRSSHGPLRVGLIADPQRLDSLASSIQACPLVELIAQAGMPQSHALRDVHWHDDERFLLAAPDLQAVLLATTTRRDIELAAHAAERKLPLWQLPPLGRNFAEATEFVTRLRRYPAVHRVASWWEHVAEQVLHEVSWPDDFTPRFSELRLSTRGPDARHWLANLEQAGGGVLANDAYPLLEALVALRGLPESITAVIARQRPAPPAAARETEDIALATLRYPGGGIASIRASWDHPPFEKQLAHHGQNATITISTDGVALTDLQGSLIDRRPFAAEWLESELLRFAEFVRGDARDRAAAPLDRHVAVSAVLETTYLAARTGHPESPSRRYEVQGWPEPRT